MHIHKMFDNNNENQKQMSIVKSKNEHKKTTRSLVVVASRYDGKLEYVRTCSVGFFW